GRKGELALETFATKMRSEGERIGVENIVIRMLERGNLSHAEIAAEVGLPLSEIKRIDEAHQTK
ncbi:MAG: hypothetical protein AAF633_25055, partial [Chloroflexota bacterium]